jgi:hypothetical protein
MWPVKPFYRRDRRGLQVPTRIPIRVWDILRRIELRRELARIDRDWSPSSAAPAELVHVRNNAALWRLTIPGNDDRYMTLTRQGAGEDSYVVMVDAARFYREWISSTLAVQNSRASASPLKRDMPIDYKYGDAIRGFSHGRRNPVPLATAGANSQYGGDRLYFINGVTRTFWLLVNGAPAFPVEVYRREPADNLHRLVGIGDGPIRVADLFAQNVWEFDDPASPWHPANSLSEDSI